jgi:hypothetical protein
VTVALQESNAPQKPLPVRAYRDDRVQEQTQGRAERLDLWTARFGVLAPTAKVLAIVAQDIVVALAEPRARTHHDLASTRRIRRDTDVKRPQPHKFMEGNFLDATQRIPTAASVMDDTAASRIDSMVSVSSPAHDKPSARHKLSVHGVTCDDFVLNDAGEL